MEVTWNEISSTTIPGLVCGKVTRPLIGGHRGTFKEIPGRDSSWYFPEERGRRRITIECHVMSQTESPSFPTGRRDQVTAVADWVDINQQAKLILGDEPTVYYNAVLVDPPDVDEWREAGIFDLTFEAEAYSYDLTPTEVTWEAVDDLPETIDFDILAPVYPVIEVTPTNGTSSTGFTLSVGGDILTYAGTVLVNNTVTINGIALVVLAGSNDDVNLTGAYNPINSLMGSVSGQFPILVPGNQEFELVSSGTSTTFDVVITYRKRYRR